MLQCRLEAVAEKDKESKVEKLMTPKVRWIAIGYMCAHSTLSYIEVGEALKKHRYATATQIVPHMEGLVRAWRRKYCPQEEYMTSSGRVWREDSDEEVTEQYKSTSIAEKGLPRLRSGCRLTVIMIKE